ncbi:MAG: ATP-binding protein [Thermoprotei archaeon]|nr:MAG: ATP-binding protein [Thermoprotei archaeon]
MTPLLDPRIVLVNKKVNEIANIIAVMSSKGGVGKTVLSTTISLLLADKGFRVGLLDLDITNPSAHIVLGVDPEKIKPIEEKGVIPPEVHGVRFMTIAFYCGENPLPLRGHNIDNVIKEVLAITNWGKLDFLVIDSPPGLSDEVLDILEYISKLKTIIITTPSPLSISATRKLIELIKEANIEILGIIENMAEKPSDTVTSLCSRHAIRYLGNVPYFHELDSLLGNVDRLVKSRFAKHVGQIIQAIIGVIHR